MPDPAPIGAATATAGVLLDLFIVLVAAKAGAELARRLAQPTVAGEIVAGVLVGPAVFGLIELGEALEIFAELGVVFLLFWVGLETRLSDMRSVGPLASRVGVLGFVAPFAGGFALGLGFGESGTTSLFLAAALVATSVGITSAVLVELGLVETRAARTILGAAVVDDILAMLLVAVAAGVASGEGADVAAIALVLALALGFVAFFALGGTALMRRRPRLLHAPRFSESPLLPAVILCLGLAAISAQIGLAAIIGSFLAGMIVAETREQHPIEEEIAPLYAFFPPFFFVWIGAQIDLTALASGSALALLAAVTATAAATKYAGAWLGARSLGPDATFVGVGMIPRGEVGIIVAGIGKAGGVLGDELFAVIVAMSVLTTLLAPPLLRLLGGRADADRAPAAGPGAIA